MNISNCIRADIDQIFRLYQVATNYQQSKNAVSWPLFDRSMVEAEIAGNRQWKLVIDDAIACVWATTFSDPLIWEEKNNDPAVYIHRIAVDTAFRGMNLVTHIVTWAKDYARKQQKQFIRLDTVGENKGLIKHYTACGFKFLGLQKLNNTSGLPAHYHQASVSLFEVAL